MIPGRDAIEHVYADIFHTEAALVRPTIVNGTHASDPDSHGDPSVREMK